MTHHRDGRGAFPVIVDSNRPAQSGRDTQTGEIVAGNELAGGDFSLAVDNDVESVYGAEGDYIRKRLVRSAHALVREIGEGSLQGEARRIISWRESVRPPFR